MVRQEKTPNALDVNKKTLAIKNVEMLMRNNDPKKRIEAYNLANEYSKEMPYFHYILALLYKDGVGVQQSNDKYHEHLQIASDYGVVEASLEYIQHMISSNNNQDRREAFILAKHLAESGNPKAQQDLSKMYANGKGTKKDANLSEKWLTIIASNESTSKDFEAKQ